MRNAEVVVFKGYSISRMIDVDHVGYVSYRETMLIETKDKVSSVERDYFKFLLTAFSSNGNRAFLVKKDDKIVGELFLSTITEGALCSLNLICLLKEAQGVGLGKILLSMTEKTALEEGCIGVVLRVESHNTQAVPFYVKHGYKEVCCESDTVTMVKRF